MPGARYVAEMFLVAVRIVYYFRLNIEGIIQNPTDSNLTSTPGRAVTNSDAGWALALGNANQMVEQRDCVKTELMSLCTGGLATTAR